jgi:cyclophilin family peptidyl-prolyl cis-trans isomerase
MNKILLSAFLLLTLGLIGAGCAPGENLGDDIDTAPVDSNQQDADNSQDTMNDEQALEHPGVLPEEEIANKQIRITTEKGDIVFDLFNETAPLAVSNFVHLTNEDYYDGIVFHRREEGFVIQGGDPWGNGRGGPGYTFKDELDDDYSYERGIVAMANRGPNTNGSQFFIMLGDTPLPKAYTVFGRVTAGMEVVDDIEIGDVMTEVTVESK